MMNKLKNIKFHTSKDNGYVMTIVPVNTTGKNNILTVVDIKNDNQSMLVGTIINIPTNLPQDDYITYKNKMIRLYETYGMVSVAQNIDEFNRTYDMVA